jgi:hypothetical protein
LDLGDRSRVEIDVKAAHDQQDVDYHRHQKKAGRAQAATRDLVEFHA